VDLSDTFIPEPNLSPVSFLAPLTNTEWIRHLQTFSAVALIDSLARHSTSFYSPDVTISIVEHLAEKYWNDALKLNDNRFNIDKLFDLLIQYDPREAAYKLVFAFKFGLPPGTIQKDLSFINNVITNQPTCLTQLKISDALISSKFLQSLNQFANL